MSDFYTRPIANEGRKLDLVTPDGKPTEHWIKVRGVDSDAFRAADADAKRMAIEVAQVSDDAERNKLIRQLEIKCIASLVSEWTFAEELTLDNVVTFLTEAPQISDMINSYAARRREYFRKK